MEEQNPLEDEQAASAYNRLRKLQEHSRSNIPAVMAYRAMSTFTLHNEPVPEQATARVLVVIYPQDPFVSDPEVRTMSAADIRPGLINSRVRIEAPPSAAAQPDEDGNYLFWPGDPCFDQVNAFYFTTLTLRMYERYARRALPWSFPSARLSVDVNAGDEANAFYNEQERKIGFHSFELNGEKISTAHSADIVSHEAAHAVLDGIRDLYNESFGLGPTAFHESFSDITAMLIALHDDSLIKRMLDWTKGDLRTNNFVTQMAEYLTQALTESDDHRLQTHSLYLRNALNDFKYIPFDNLLYAPEDPEFTLGRQPHNYSRLLTGTFYDVFSGLHEAIQADGTPSHIAIYRARDISGSLLMMLLELGPVGEFDYSDLARCALSAEMILYGGKYQAAIRKVLLKRGLLDDAQITAHLASLEALPHLSLPETINSALASALYLEQTVLPALDLESDVELIPLAAYRNAPGYAFMTYFSSQRMTLTGAEYGQFDNAVIELYGGLTLCFDPSNRLRNVCYRPITAEDERQVGVMIQDLIRLGYITDKIHLKPRAFRYHHPQGVILPEQDKTGQLIRYPAIFDLFPSTRVDAVAYFKQMYEKMRGI
jgi:hypothetical protein